MPDNAQEFLEKASQDIYAVEILISDAGVASWIIGFHCRQAVEKSLKAVLVHRSIHFQKIHDLYRLVQLLEDAGVMLPSWAATLDVLGPFAVVARYADVVPEDFSPAEALELARRVRDWARREPASV
jgi:HEPN domain-containing protein